MKATLFSDGGARGNPGPAGIGYVLRIVGKEPILCKAYVGETTNNQAEYLAVRDGLARAKAEGVTEIECFLDSELVVKQLRGEYRVKDAALRERFDEVRVLQQQFSGISFAHVRRAKNKEADRLVNEAIDEKKSL